MLCRVTSAAVMRKPRNQPVRIMRYAALVRFKRGVARDYFVILITSMLLPRKSSENCPGLRVGNLTL
jgi:hypothetical protein